ncbi:sigma-54-dependent Fis family transcriptional regulator [Zobellella maritima]|uniref:sigma-54-dependent Fis family transcriptional regulator n=1 Tax=Zobellella maritima TaxID=2059725 RepID=UPI000E304ADD|nr:sigma-54-dependent Fis family transcriptional regulator [Zobellella maritima]
MAITTALYQPQDLHLLERSWQRSRDYGLSHGGQCDPRCLSRQDLQYKQQQHALLLRYLGNSLPLFEQLQHGRHCRLIFADAEGTILFTAGDPRFGNKAQKVALASGASWHEQSMGTNAIGTALKEQQEISILGQQHFLAANHGISCSASPVLSPDGELLGVIDISSEAGEHCQDMLLTARLMALSIENALVMNHDDTHWILNLAPDAGSLQQPWSGIIALREDGQLLGANRSARNWLHELDIPAMLTGLKQGELTPVGQGMALLSRQPGSRRPPRSPALASSALESKALKLMDRQIPLLIQGETGTGKDYLVRRLHRQSSRAQAPLVAINCGALPSELLEAELFGYLPGAFTGGSKQGRPGYVRAAHGGILFLDEIGELPLAAQTRLLRVLQEKSVTPLGSHVPEPVDFQLIAASHRELTTMVGEGRFRQDLYFRINGFTLTLPPLREYSRDDIKQLVMALLAEQQGGEASTLDDAAMAILCDYPWPGNIRQLKQVLEVAAVLADDGRIGPAHLPELPAFDGPDPAPRDLKTQGEQLIAQTLAECNGNVSAAARRLKVSRTTLYSKLKSLGVKP